MGRQYKSMQSELNARIKALERDLETLTTKFGTIFMSPYKVYD